MESHFEQREPPTNDKLTQMNLCGEATPKPISVNETLSSFERENIILLKHEYIVVFDWIYEDIPDLDSIATMHSHFINPKVKPVK